MPGIDQLTLVEIAPQPRIRTARAGRRPPPSSGQQLPLSLPPPRGAGETGRRLGLPRALAPPEEPGPPRESIFLLRARAGAQRQRDLLAELCDWLGLPPPRRERLLDHLEDGLRLRASVDDRFLRVTFGGERSRERWLRAVQAFARDGGLVEPE